MRELHPEANIPPLTRRPVEPEPEPWVPTDLDEALTAAEFGLGHLGLLKVYDHQIEELKRKRQELIEASKAEIQTAIEALKRAGV